MKPELVKAVELVKAGKTYNKAASLTGLTRNQVSGACRRAGIRKGCQTGGHNFKLSRRQIQSRLELAKQSHSVSDFAARATLSVGGARTFLFQYAPSLARKLADQGTAAKEVPESVVAHRLAVAEDAESLADFSRRVGMSSPGGLMFLKRYAPALRAQLAAKGKARRGAA